VNLFDHWWEDSKEVGGVLPRQRILDAWLRELPAEKVWWPSARELALWLELARSAHVSWEEHRNRLRLVVEPPASWSRSAAAGRLDTTMKVHIPSGRAVQAVRVDGQLLDPGRWWATSGGTLVVCFPIAGRTTLDLSFERPGRSRRSAAGGRGTGRTSLTAERHPGPAPPRS